MNKFPGYTIETLVDRPMAEIVYLAEYAAYLHQESMVSSMMASISMSLMGASGTTPKATSRGRGKL